MTVLIEVIDTRQSDKHLDGNRQQGDYALKIVYSKFISQSFVHSLLSHW